MVLGESEEYIYRFLQIADYEKGYLKCLNQLGGAVGDVSWEEWKSFLNRIPNNHSTIIIENKKLSQIAAIATLIVEQKFTHRCQCIGHVEDVVVLKSFRGQGLGRILLNLVKDLAQRERCYKVVLNCQRKNVGFYEKFDFKEKEVFMQHYFCEKKEEKSKEKQFEEKETEINRKEKQEKKNNFSNNKNTQNEIEANSYYLIYVLGIVALIGAVFFINPLNDS